MTRVSSSQTLGQGSRFTTRLELTIVRQANGLAIIVRRISFKSSMSARILRIRLFILIGGVAICLAGGFGNEVPRDGQAIVLHKRVAELSTIGRLELRVAVLR